MAQKKDPEYVREFLESYTVSHLKPLVPLVSSARPTRKADLVDEIARHLRDPTRLRTLWNSLNQLQQDAVSEALDSPDHRFNAVSFKAKYGSEPDWGTRGRYGYGDSQPSLLQLFIFNHQIPRDLVEPLLAIVPAPRSAKANAMPELGDTVTISWTMYDWRSGKRVPRSQEVEATHALTEPAALHDIQAVLRLIESGKVKVSAKTKRPSAVTVREVGKILHGGDFYPPEDNPPYEWSTVPGPMKAFAWPLIVQSAGFAKISGTKLELTPSGKKALNNAPEKALRTAWKKWLKTTILDEFSRIEAIKGQRGKGKRTMTAPAKRRAMIADALTDSPTKKWISFDEFSRFMKASSYTFKVNRNLWNLYVEEQGYGSLGYEGFGGWHIIQARYLMVFLLEYAATMGLLDVALTHPRDARPDYGDLWGTDDYDALSRYDGLTTIRINSLGAYCLGHTNSYSYTPSLFEEKKSLKILPNMDLVATDTITPSDKLFIDLFAEQTSDRVWHIEQKLLLKMVEEGRSIGEVVKFLEALSETGLPDNVAIFFNEMAERVSKLADRGLARVIEVKDPVLAHLILNNSKVGKSCLLAGERHLVVPVSEETAFRRALRELGYAYKREG
ncbi:hypothetical protein QUF64_09470 [Anaerolineales bacterium HSG6]|nr:hypothetical protein [Anaerolineales bacterium HSG6]